MDSTRRPPPPDERHPTPEAVNGSAVQSPAREPEATEVEPRINSSATDEEDATGRGIRSPSYSAAAETKALVTRASSVKEDAAVDVSPSPSSEKNHTASPQLGLRVSRIQDEAVTGSPVGSPSLSSENHDTVSPMESRAMVPRASSLRAEAVIGPPVRSSHREAMQARYEQQNSFSSVSSYRSPLRDAENPTASPPLKEMALGSPMRGALTVGALLQSPIGNAAAEDPSLEKVTSPMVAATNRMVARETPSASKVGGDGEWRGSTGVESGASRQQRMIKAVVGLRIMALVLSLISFSVMAADKTSGWDGDSFDRYSEFRYCLSVNVISFVYSFFQLYVQIHHRIMKRRLMSRPVGYSFDFCMDQILAYLLMSASSSAASRNGDWVLDFGSDGFTKMIDGSIAMSFLAFFALAFSSIISAYKFFSWNS